MNPRIRVDHAKPTNRNNFSRIKGKRIPPIEPEVIAIPVAIPLFWRKKWPIEAIQGVFMRQPPIPLRTLYTMKKCQYSRHISHVHFGFDGIRTCALSKEKHRQNKKDATRKHDYSWAV